MSAACELGIAQPGADACSVAPALPQPEAIPRVTGVANNGVPPLPGSAAPARDAAPSSGGFLGRSWK